MDDKEITTEGMKNTLSGHLCRCTGYRSLKRGIDFLKLSVESRTGIQSLVANEMLPLISWKCPTVCAKSPNSA